MKSHRLKKKRKKTQCWPEILLERLIDNVYICIWKSILRRGRLFQIYHICEIFQGTFHLGLVFAKLLILNICISSILGSHARGREGGGKLVWNEQNFFPTASPPPPCFLRRLLFIFFCCHRSVNENENCKKALSLWQFLMDRSGNWPYIVSRGCWTNI